MVLQNIIITKKGWKVVILGANRGLERKVSLAHMNIQWLLKIHIMHCVFVRTISHNKLSNLKSIIVITLSGFYRFAHLASFSKFEIVGQKSISSTFDEIFFANFSLLKNTNADCKQRKACIIISYEKICLYNLMT